MTVFQTVFYIMYHENHIPIENFLNSYMAREPKPSGISPVYHHPRCCRCVGKTPDAFFVCEVEDRKPSKINQEDCNPLGTELKWSPTDKIWITYVCKRSLTITEIVGTSVKLKRTSRFVPDHFRRSEMSATLCLHSSQQNLGRQGKSENQIELVKIVEKIGLGHPTRGIGRGHVWPVKEWAEGTGFEFVPCRKMLSERLVWGTYDRDKAH